LVGIVITSHGTLAEGLRAAAQMILGQQEAVQTVGLGPAEDLDEFLTKLRQAAAEVNRDSGVLVLADLFGGSPCNTAAYLVQEGMEVVTGANLPMLLEALSQREERNPKELAEAVIAAAREGTRRLADVL